MRPPEGFLPFATAFFFFSAISSLPRIILLCFPVNRVLITEATELFELQFIGRIHLILFRVVIALFAF